MHLWTLKKTQRTTMHKQCAHPIQKQQNVKTEHQISGDFSFLFWRHQTLIDLPLPVDKLHMVMWSTVDNRPGFEGQSAISDFAWVLPFLKTLLQNTGLLCYHAVSRGYYGRRETTTLNSTCFGSEVQILGYFPWYVIPSVWQKQQVSHTYVGITHYQKRYIQDT